MKQLKAENDVLNKNAASLLRNIVMMALRNKPKSLEEISNYSGIQQDKLKPFLDAFAQGKLITVKDNRYSLVKGS
jgi:predicted transcriptional regulator